MPVRWSRIITERVIFHIVYYGRDDFGAGKSVSMRLSCLGKRERSYLLLVAKPVLLADPFRLSDPDADVRPPAALPSGVAGLEELLASLMSLVEPVLLADPFIVSIPDADTGPPASPPIVAGPEALLATLAPPVLPLEAPMPVSTGQSPLLLMETVTVVTYWASISVALSLKSARTAIESPSQVFILHRRVEAQDSEGLQQYIER